MTTLPGNLTARSDDPSAPYWKRYKHQPHWRNNADEYAAAKLGMWLFLTTELLLFSGMFVAYWCFKMLHLDTWKAASHYYLSWEIGAINTVVLLISSFTMAMAIRAAQVNKQGQLILNLLITIVCGVFFLVVKIGWEYIPKIQKGELPGGLFTYYGSFGHGHNYIPSDYDPLFLAVYWVATAIHGSHVLVGVLLLSWCVVRAKRGHFGPRHFTYLENTGLFWHLVDLIWIFLFPLMYLVG